RGTAVAAKMLEAHLAVVATLAIDLWRTGGEVDIGPGTVDRHTERGAGQRLAIGTVAHRDRLGVDLGVIGDPSAMALPVDLHAFVSKSYPTTKTAPEGAVL